MRTIHLRTKRYPARGRARRVITSLFCIGAVYITMGLSTGQWLPPGMSPRETATPIPLYTEPPATPHPGATHVLEAEDTALILPRQAWYAVSLGEYNTLEEAQAQAEVYQRRGAAGYVLADADYQVLAAAYPRLEEADSVREQLREDSTLDTLLYPILAEEVELRVTATSMQLSALGQGYTLLPEMIEELSRLSLALDKGVMDVSSVTSAAKNHAARITALMETLDLSLGTSKSGIVTGLFDMLHACAQAMENISAQNDTPILDLSAQIKYNHLDILWRYVQYIRQLTAYRV